MKSAQVAATEAINNIAGYFIAHDPCPILKLDPTVEMGEDWSKRRLATMLRDTPAIRGKVKEAKSRDSGNTILQKNFPGGSLAIVGANSPSGLASRPIRIVLADEIDRYPVSAGSEGDPLDLAIKRTQTFWNRKIVMFSTPTVKGVSRIETAYLESDQRKRFLPCLHCGHFQVFMWRHVHIPDGAPEKAHLVCEQCGSEITERDRLRSLVDGEWRAQAAFNGIAGFWSNELISPFSSVGKMATEWSRVHKFKDRLRVFVNTTLGETWEEEPEGDGLDPLALTTRADQDPEPYHYGEIPERVCYLTAAIDRQRDRLEAMIMGWAPGDEGWVLDYRIFPHDPAKLPPWAELDDWIDTARVHTVGASLQIGLSLIDSGYDADRTYQYVKTSRLRRLFAIKGGNQRDTPIIPKRPTKIKTKLGTLPLFVLGVHQAKDLAFSNLQISNPGPGYIHFAKDCDADFFKQLTAEKKITRYAHGQPYQVWHLPSGARNEAGDLFVYNLCALRIARPNLEKEAARLNAMRRTDNENTPPTGSTPPAEEAPKPRRITTIRNNWVNS